MTRTQTIAPQLATKPGELAVQRKSLPAEIPETGLSIAECYDAAFSKATDEDFMWCHRAIETAYGQRIPVERWEQLRDMIEEERWSGARLRAQTKAFLKYHKPIWRADTPPWIPADFFSVQSDLKLKPPIAGRDFPANSDIYRIAGQLFWRERDGIELPFERIVPRPRPEPAETTPEPMPEEMSAARALMERIRRSEERTGAMETAGIVSELPIE